MKLSFEKREGGRSAPREVASLHFASRELREGAQGTLIARHVGHYWVVAGEEHLRLDCSGPLRIVFVAEAPRRSAYGPHEHFSCVYGIAFADTLVIAHLDAASQRWFVIADGTEWPSWLIEPVS